MSSSNKPPQGIIFFTVVVLQCGEPSSTFCSVHFHPACELTARNFQNVNHQTPLKAPQKQRNLSDKRFIKLLIREAGVIMRGGGGVTPFCPAKRGSFDLSTR